MQIPSQNSRPIAVYPFTANRNAPRRTLPFHPMRALLFLAMGLLVFCPVTARAQTEITTAPPGFSDPGRANPNADTALRRMTEHMARERNVQRQKQIVADTNRLLSLAKELNDAVSHSTKDTLSLDVVKKADEIEKLAKTIKQRMRDGE